MRYSDQERKCSKCNKPFRHDCKQTHCHCICHICHSSYMDCKCREQKRYCDCSNQCERFICNDDFRYRLGGLQGGLAFRLRKLIGCEVKMQVECDGCEEMNGTIKFVGKDWVELEVDKVWEEKEDHHNDENTEVQNSASSRRNRKRRRREMLKENRKSSYHHLKPTRIIPFESIKWTDIHNHHHC